MNAEQIRRVLKRELAGLDRNDIDEMAIPSYTHRNPLVRWIIRRRLRVIATRMRRLGVRDYLDFGCGLGFLEVLMAGAGGRVFVTDLKLAPARAIHRHFLLEGIQYLEPDAWAGVIPPGSLDAIVAADVLEHVDDLKGYVDRFAGLLRPGGLFFLSGPTETPLYRLCRKIAGFTGEYHVRDIYEIERVFEDGGWRLAERKLLPIPGPFQMFSVTIWRRP